MGRSDSFQGKLNVRLHIYLCVLKLKQYVSTGEAFIYFFAVNVILVLLCTNKDKMDFFLDLLS